MEHPKDVGDRSMLAILAALQELRYALYIPFGENTRCDLVLERNGSMIRVQCKSGRLRGGAVRFAVCSNYGHHPNPRIRSRAYHGEVDYFAVYCKDTSGVYLVPIDDLPMTREGCLRLDPPRNNQSKRIRFAADYQIGSVAIGGLRGSAGGR